MIFVWCKEEKRLRLDNNFVFHRLSLALLVYNGIFVYRILFFIYRERLYLAW